MRSKIVILFLAVSFLVKAQDELLIARTTGTKTLVDGSVINTFGFAKRLSENPNVPGPTLEFYEGDSVVIDMWNVSQASTHTIHLHGLDVNQQNDGVPHLSFEVDHMEHGLYRFKAPHPGTYLYHCHVVSVLHVQAGMYGLLIIKPKGKENKTWENGYEFRRAYNFLTSEIDTAWHSLEVLEHSHDHSAIAVPDYEPTYFLCNGLADSEYNFGDSLRFSTDANSYLRFANIGYYGNRIILPKGLNAKVIDSDGRPLPDVFDWDTIMIYPGERYSVLVNPTLNFADSIKIEYVNMNTHQTRGVNKLSFKTYNSAGIESDLKFSVKMTPNPFYNELHISSINAFNGIELCDVLGNQILAESLVVCREYRANTTSFQSGVYILKVKFLDGTSLSKKVIKY
jgi:FtsP/CotA-like multicopper oxidase with cupredoxin domain